MGGRAAEGLVRVEGGAPEGSWQCGGRIDVWLGGEEGGKKKGRRVGETAAGDVQRGKRMLDE